MIRINLLRWRAGAAVSGGALGIGPRSTSLVALLAAGVMLLSGCGGEETPPSKSSPSPGPSPGVSPGPAAGGSPGAAGGATPGAAPSGHAGQPGTSGGTPRVAKKPPAPKLPGDLAAWTDEHFVSAKKTGHAQLVKAITLRAQKTQKDAGAARLWRTLLATKTEKRRAGAGGISGDPAADPSGDPAADDPAGDPAGDPALDDPALDDPAADPSLDDPAADPSEGGGGRQQQQPVVTALLTALASNTTAEAAGAMKETLQGAYASDVDDATLATLAFAVLMDHVVDRPEDPRTKTLSTVLTKPEELRPAGQQGKMTAAALHKSALQGLAGKELPQLRAQLAGMVGGVQPAYRKALLTALTQQRLDNFNAQLQLYRRGPIDAATKNRLGEYFTDYGRQAFNLLLGIPELERKRNDSGADDAGIDPADDPAAALDDVDPADPASDPAAAGGARGNRGSSAGSKTVKPEQVKDVLGLLWASPFVDDMAGKVDGAKLTDAPTLTLGGVLPFSPVRRSFHNLIQKNWEREGTVELTQVGAFRDAMRDPGLLLAVKSVPWKNRLLPKGRKSGSRSDGADAGADLDDPAALDGGGGGRRPEVKRPKNDTEAKNQFRDGAEQMVRAWFERLRSVNNAEGRDPPLPLPRNAEASSVTSQYYVKWPDDLPAEAKTLDVPPMTLHYARIDMTGNFNTVKGHYYSKVTYRKSHVLDEGRGHWLENRRSRDGVLTSLDVMITRPKQSGSSGPPPSRTSGRRRAKPEALVIEMLLVEISDYQAK